MNTQRSRVSSDSPYVAFKDDRERKWALVSRDVRLVLIDLAPVFPDPSYSQRNAVPLTGEWRAWAA